MSSPSFKDLVRSDIKDVFLKDEEFSEIHTINGKEISVIIDDNELFDRQKRQNESQNYGDTYVAEKILYVCADEYGPRPKIGNLLLLDGKKQYTVTNVQDEDGIYGITVKAVKL